MRLVTIATLTAMLCLSGLLGCERPGEEPCKQACLHRAKLFHEDKWDRKMAEAKESERASLRDQKVADWQDVLKNPERGLEACIGACNRMGRQPLVDCLLESKTLADAEECED